MWKVYFLKEKAKYFSLRHKDFAYFASKYRYTKCYGTWWLAVNKNHCQKSHNQIYIYDDVLCISHFDDGYIFSISRVMCGRRCVTPSFTHTRLSSKPVAAAAGWSRVVF